MAPATDREQHLDRDVGVAVGSEFFDSCVERTVACHDRLGNTQGGSPHAGIGIVEPMRDDLRIDGVESFERPERVQSAQGLFA